MSIKDKFPNVLKHKLKSKYGHIPSCTMFANHFNLRTLSDKTITRETARRWLSGESFPNLDNFYTLSNWLSFNENDLVTIFDIKNNAINNQTNNDFSSKYNSLIETNKLIISGIADVLISNQKNSIEK